MPLSIQAPFFTERGIDSFPISDCRFLIFRLAAALAAFTNLKSQIKNLKSLDSPISHNHLLRPLVTTGLVTARGLSPGRNRMSATGSLALAAAVRMVYRIHRHTADMRSDTAPAR